MRKIVKKEKNLISQGFQKRRTPLFDKIIRKAESVHTMDQLKVRVIELFRAIAVAVSIGIHLKCTF